MSQGRLLEHREGVRVVGGDAGVGRRMAGAVDQAEPALTFQLPTMTTLRGLPSRVARMVQVVQPRVWPGVLCAVSTAPPSRTSSPSCRMRSTLAGG